MSKGWIIFIVLSNIYDRLTACEIDGTAVLFFDKILYSKIIQWIWIGYVQ